MIKNEHKEERKVERVKVDKEKLNRLLSLPDEELWRELVRIGGSYGFRLPDKTPPQDQLTRLRQTVKGDRINAHDALKMLNSIRKENRNG